MSNPHALLCPYRHVPNCDFYDFETGACNAELGSILLYICSIISEDLTMKKIKAFSISDFQNMIESAEKTETIAAVIVLLLAQWKKKQSNTVAVGAVLRACAVWCESHV